MKTESPLQKEIASRQFKWSNSQRGDLMLQMALGREVDRKVLATIACECIHTAIPKIESPTVLACLEAIELWIQEKWPTSSVRATGILCCQNSHFNGHADYATYAASDIVCSMSTDPVANLIVVVVDCARAAAALAARTCGSTVKAPHVAKATHSAMLSQCANIIRKHLPDVP